MYVRVFDKQNNRYYKSIVYCIIHQAGLRRQFVVINPYNNCFELVDFLDKSKKETVYLVEYIQLDSDDWILYETAYLLKYKRYCRDHSKDDKIESLWGYRDICENFEFLCDILENRSLPVNKSDIVIRTLPDTEDWQYILTQDDADEFMKLFVGFHDSTLKKLTYEEVQATSSAITIFDNSAWYGIVEICFEKIVAINIRPEEENLEPYIYDATLIVNNEGVFWADSYMEAEDTSYDGTYIKALSMKWRKIG